MQAPISILIFASFVCSASVASLKTLRGSKQEPVGLEVNVTSDPLFKINVTAITATLPSQTTPVVNAHAVNDMAADLYNTEAVPNEAAGGDLAHMEDYFVTPAPASKPTVCVSYLAYEPPEWISALLHNAAHFTEADTRFALHLNGRADYNETCLGAWESDRVTVTRTRVEVRWGSGSILYAHLLNARQFEKTWPGQCEYFVMQASNALWVRPGMEDIVRQRGMSHVKVRAGMTDKLIEHPFFKKISGKRGITPAWSQPEGAYFPMKLVTAMADDLDNWLETCGADLHDSVLMNGPALEEFWLQTYAVNNIEPPLCLEGSSQSASEYSGDDQSLVPLDQCANYIGKPVTFRSEGVGKGTGDSKVICTVEDVQEIIHNNSLYFKYSEPFAVKRVERDFDHPTTKFILGLASFEGPSLSETSCNYTYVPMGGKDELMPHQSASGGVSADADRGGRLGHQNSPRAAKRSLLDSIERKWAGKAPPPMCT